MSWLLQLWVSNFDCSRNPCFIFYLQDFLTGEVKSVEAPPLWFYSYPTRGKLVMYNFEWLPFKCNSVCPTSKIPTWPPVTTQLKFFKVKFGNFGITLTNIPKLFLFSEGELKHWHTPVYQGRSWPPLTWVKAGLEIYRMVSQTDSLWNRVLNLALFLATPTHLPSRSGILSKNFTEYRKSSRPDCYRNMPMWWVHFCQD